MAGETYRGTYLNVYGDDPDWATAKENALFKTILDWLPDRTTTPANTVVGTEHKHYGVFNPLGTTSMITCSATSIDINEGAARIRLDPTQIIAWIGTSVLTIDNGATEDAAVAMSHDYKDHDLLKLTLSNATWNAVTDAAFINFLGTVDATGLTFGYPIVESGINMTQQDQFVKIMVNGVERYLRTYKNTYTP